LEAVRVAAGARGRGLDAALVGWAVGEAARRGCGLVLFTTESRPDASRFHERLGAVAFHEGLELRLASCSYAGRGTAGEGTGGPT
jgi:GNAT superfamily N-acetyltransferase